MLTVFLRATILFVFAVISMRLMGKRQVSQLQPFELVVAFMIADLATTPMESVGTPLLYGIFPMLALVILHSLLAFLSMKSQRLRGLISGTPTILVKNGQVQLRELEKLCFNLNDLLEEIRAGGILNPAEVGTVIMETSGKMSVFPMAKNVSPTRQELAVAVQEDEIPLTLILDGKVQKDNLKIGSLTETWLRKQCEALGYKRISDVLLLSLCQGKVYLQARAGQRPQLVQMLPTEGK